MILYSAYLTMASGAPPKVNALKKCSGWFPGVHNTSIQAFPPAVSLDGGTVVVKGVDPKFSSSITLSSPLQGILFCLLVTLIVSFARRSRQKLPPQPRRLPILGNFFQMANRKWLYSQECKERFGEYLAPIQRVLT